MDVRKTLIALGVVTALVTGLPTSAIAKKTDEDDSVHRWGRWEVLSPAAGVEELPAFPAVAGNEIGRCESGKNCPEPQSIPEPPPPEPPPPPPPPPPEVRSPCEAGMPCGFARVDLTDSESETGSSYVAAFALDMNELDPEDEGTSNVAFGVGAGTLLDPDTTDEINSDTEAATYSETSVRVLDNNADSYLRGRITRDGGEKVLVTGLWEHDGVGGEYVWGIAATDAQMGALKDQLLEIQGNLTAIYSGAIANGGSVVMQVDFNDATWSGQFNGNVGFSASGDVIGSGFVSDAAGFSANIAEGVVKGGFVNAGRNAIGGYEVVDVEGLRDADVFNAGLVQEQTQLEPASLR